MLVNFLCYIYLLASKPILYFRQLLGYLCYIIPIFIFYVIFIFISIRHTDKTTPTYLKLWLLILKI